MGAEKTARLYTLYMKKINRKRPKKTPTNNLGFFSG
jgi:hypothetical protein